MHTLGIAVISVYKDYEMSGIDSHLGAFIVTCRCANATDSVTINWKTVNVYHAATDTLIGFTFATDAKRQSVTNKFICIETANAIAIGNGSKIDEVNKCVTLI